MALPALLAIACAEEGDDTGRPGASGEAASGISITSALPTSGASTGANTGASDGATAGAGDAGTTQGPAPGTTEPSDGSSTAASTATSSAATSDATATTEPSPTTSSTGDRPDTTDGSTGPGDKPPPPGRGPDPDLLVALVGDLGAGAHPRSVFKMIAAEKADFLIILGDLDYGDSPSTFKSDLEAGLGPDFPVFGVIGNHDVKKWSGYQPIFEDRLAKIAGAECTGDLGVDAACTYRGLRFVLSGVGTIGSKGQHEDYLAGALADDDSPWTLCAWHKNQRDMQAGDKSDEVGWTAYQHCQDDGAIVVTGHEHSYARTRTLTDLGNAKNQHGAVGMPELLEVGPGSTFAVVSGLGGKSIRNYSANLHANQQWWASFYTGDYHRKNGTEVKGSKANYGALFLRFHVDGDPDAAHGYFKSVDGEVADEFDVVRKP